MGFKVGIGKRSQEIREGRFAYPGRTPKNHRREKVRFRKFPDNAVFPYQMFLSYDIIQFLRAQYVGKRSMLIHFSVFYTSGQRQTSLWRSRTLPNAIRSSTFWSI